MAESNNDHIRSVLKKALKNEFDVSDEDDIQFGNISQSSGSGVGDNFGGLLKLISFTFSIRNKVEEQLHSYIVKSLPTEAHVKDMLEDVSLALITNCIQKSPKLYWRNCNIEYLKIIF